MHIRSVFRQPILAAVCLASALLIGCDHARPPRSDKPTVVCTIFPLASVVQQVAGPGVEVITAVPAGVSPHGFEPTARQVSAMQSAWLIVSVGLGYDEWAHTSAQRSQIPLIELGEVVTLPKGALESADGGEKSHKHDHDEHDHHHHHGAANPHIWVDPVVMIELVEKLAVSAPLLEAAQAAGEDAVAVARRAATLIAELKALDDEFRTHLAPYQGAKFVTYHNAFDLMAQRYGLEVAATLTPIDSPAGMTPKRLEQAIEVIQRHHVKAVFAEPQFPNEAGRVVQQETGVKVLTLDCLGDPNDPARASYLQMMRYNLAALLEGLK